MLFVVTIETLVPKMIAKIFFLSNASVRNLKLCEEKVLGTCSNFLLGFLRVGYVEGKKE